jgi:uncharacterized protein (DUF58 family)
MSSLTGRADAFFARSAVIRAIARVYRERFTPAGQIIIVGAAAALVLGVDYDVPIYYIWLSGTGILITAALAGALAGRARVRAERRLPRHVCAGETISYEVRLTNLSPRPARGLVIEELGLPPELKPGPEGPAEVRFLPGQATAAVRLGLACAKRGIHPLPRLTVSSTFPSGLYKLRRQTADPDELLVYPAFRRLHDFRLPAPRRYQPGGLSMTSDVGDSTEFMSTREYRYGDNVRDIHWASWARTGKPVVKEYQEEYFVRLALLLDSLVPAGRDDAAFEAGVSLAASVADVLSRKEYIIDIFAAGEQIHRFQAGRALAHFDNILEILACLTPSPTVDMAAVLSALRPESARLSALVCIMMDWDDQRRRLVESLGLLGLSTRTIIVRPDPPTLAPTGQPGVTWYRPGSPLESIG